MSDDEKRYIDPKRLADLGAALEEQRIFPPGTRRIGREDVTVLFKQGSTKREAFEKRILEKVFANDPVVFRESCTIREENGLASYSFINFIAVTENDVTRREALKELHEGTTKTILDIAKDYDCKCFSRKSASQSIQ